MTENQPLTRGLLLPCFGKRGYYYAAYNYAFSVKFHNPNVQIALLHDGQIEKELSYGYMPHVFDYKIQIPDEVLWHGGRIDPAYIKMSAINFSPFDITLLTDVDMVALSDITPIFDELEKAGGYFYSHILGTHTIQQGTDDIPEMVWAKAGDIWSHFNLPSDAVLPATNSSFQYWKKGPEAAALHKQLRDNFTHPIPIDRLRYAWGGTQPDELYLNVALAQKGITGQTPRQYLWMANGSTDCVRTKLADQYPIMCMFGHRNLPKVFFTEWYDELLIKWHSERGLPHHLKWWMIAEDKHANTAIIRQRAPEYIDDIMTQTKHAEKVNLFISYFQDPAPERHAEIVKALKMNSATTEIDRIFLVTEQPVEKPIASDKVEILRVPKRTTYKDMITLANAAAGRDTITIIANADIYFDDRNLQLIKELNYIDTAYALSRWDVQPNGDAKHFNYEWSQDTWIFKGQIPEMDVDFILGVPACDNRMAFEMSKAYRRVGNPSYTIKSYHIHHTGFHRYSESDRLPGEVKSIYAETAKPYLKQRLLMIQHGKVGDILICLPIARALSEEYLVDWLCPHQYHPLFRYVQYCRPVDKQLGQYSRVLDLSFGQGGAPEAWWQREKQRFSSFVEAKYELAGIPVQKRDVLEYTPDLAAEGELYERIVKLTSGRPYALIHDSSDYGTAARISPGCVSNVLEPVYFKQLPGTMYTIFDWRKVILHAEEIHCIDSSLCNFVDVLPEAKDIKKVYYKTDKVPNQWDETILNNNWIRSDGKPQKIEADEVSA